MTPKVVMLLASHGTQNALSAWCQAAGFDLTATYSGETQAPEDFDFHATLFATKNAVSIPVTQHQIAPVEIEAVGFDVLGVDRIVPVLKLAPGRLARMREFYLDTYGAEPTFDEFKAHVSLSYAWQGEPRLTGLEPPPFPVAFDQLRVAEFDPAPAQPVTKATRRQARFMASPVRHTTGAHRLYASP